MEDVCVFVKYNGHWDGTLRYVGGEMNGILVPETATYVGFIELVRSAIGIRGPAKTIVMRYGVEPGLPLVRIQCDADIKFYIQLKKKDVYVLSKFSITIDVLDESAAKAMPLELGESNYIDIQLSRKGVQSDEAIQHVDDRNLIIPHPPPHITPLPLHVDELKFAGDAHQSNENSIAASIGAHSITNNTTSQSVNIPSSDSVSGSVVVADYTPVTMHKNCIFENKKLLQYHLHHDAMSKHYQFKVKRSNSTLLHVICIDIEKCPWQLRATRMRDSELFVVKQYDDVHTCSIEIVQGHHRQAKSWMIGECVKVKYLDPTNTSYRPREIMQDMQVEFGVSFNYLRAWRGNEVALTSLRGDDTESYNADQFEYPATNNASQIWIVDMSEMTCTCRRFQVDQIHCPHAMASILLAAQMAEMFLKNSGRKLSILPKQSVGPEGHGFEGFCPKEKNMSLFGVVDVMVMDTTDKPVPIQYP
ncbi:hypothetical protein TIFTF001_031131 [Ficus carica]|uniref:SWIM-type domain-containing protein n=1 Tax=Ficus carica TaxID=3494 RepID=A0AA88E0B1_FICCA|nr:hypothetical protein TIFTF001_031131 [Ficus carica]